MILKKYLLFFYITFYLCSCNIFHNDDLYFNGEIKCFKDLKAEQISLEIVALEDIYAGVPAVYDSVAVFWNQKLPVNQFNIFNLNTGEYLGEYCRRGGGPEETSGLPFISNFYEQDNEIKTLLFAPNEKKILIWNISKSIKERRTVNDTIIPYDHTKEHPIAVYLHINYIDNNRLITNIPAVNLTMDGSLNSVPFYQERTLFGNELIKQYDIFKQSINNKKAYIMPENFFNSWTFVKPDGSKIAEGMRFLSQINILDLKEDEVTGFRMENTPDFSFFKTSMSETHLYFTRLHGDDNYIYGLYSGELYESGDFPHIIFVFDWNGNLIKKWELGMPVREIWVDNVQNVLYVINAETEELYKYDLSNIITI